MKYMGSKRWMLGNGLGTIISRELKGKSRFIDLFTGSAAVATHVATRFSIPVAACDLQTFSVTLAAAVLERDRRVDDSVLFPEWLKKAEQVRIHPPTLTKVTRSTVTGQREWCSAQGGTITKAYGGFYFSALQAAWLDALRSSLPSHEPERSVALAALIYAASNCAAAPGHTAQPFQPTRTAKPYILESWNKDIVASCQKAFRAVAKQHAQTTGRSVVADANKIAESARAGDLLFIDPPYSGVHYSRFYHVLETLARGHCGEVSGRGRYPAPHERPRSSYSIRTKSHVALEGLLRAISLNRATAIVTFPQRLCSNGLSGGIVINLAKSYFDVEQHWVSSKFSTLGGDNDHRGARQKTRELILVLKPN